MTTKRKPRQKKTLTYGEFMAWLEGVEEMQPSDWSPDPAQWKLIKSKLKTIVPEQQQVETPAPNQHVQQPHGGFDSQPMPQVPGLPPGVLPPPEVPSSIPLGSVIDNSRAGPVGGMETKTGANGEQVLKTPDIEGSYDNSQFS